ncbi:hypothetical protein [Streptomyces canus]|uniref:hypothetical protein n=1 Tax=Streptomyces canus TaxID=58343 RepID=UPI002E354B9F|nr:hypothetical protein [Streptomyces canus]
MDLPLPARDVEPGGRTGAYRRGDHQLLTDGAGNSRINTEDYAVALVDELQKGGLTRTEKLTRHHGVSR